MLKKIAVKSLICVFRPEPSKSCIPNELADASGENIQITAINANIIDLINNNNNNDNDNNNNNDNDNNNNNNNYVDNL